MFFEDEFSYLVVNEKMMYHFPSFSKLEKKDTSNLL